MYHNYKKRPPHRRIKDYFLPFFIVFMILAIVVAGWRMMNKVFIDGHKNTFTEKVFLNIDSGSVKAMTVNRAEWKNAPDNIYLYSGEKLKTGSDGRSALTFSDKSIVRMDNNSEIEFLQLKKKKEAFVTELGLIKGRLWSESEGADDSDSRFSVTTDFLIIDARKGIFAIDAPGTVYVLEGEVQVGIKYDDDVIKTINVGVGQQLMVDELVLDNINNGLDQDIIFALNDSFKSSSWYRWNIKKDGAITAFEEPTDIVDDDLESDLTDETDNSNGTINIGRMVSITKPSHNTSTSKSSISLEGTFNSEKIKSVYISGKKADINDDKWTISNISLSSEGKNSLSVEVETIDGQRNSVDSFVITYDKTPPAVPVLTEPVSEGGDDIEINTIEQLITGTVSSDTYAVIVNDYRLGKYVPGSGKFQYYAKIAYGNLKAGENEYLIYAEDKAGNQSDPAKIILVLDEDSIPEDVLKASEEVVSSDDETADETKEDSSSDETSIPIAESTGGVKITAPNGGESFQTSETAFEIIGSVPSGAVKVVVNDYQLQAFTEGDTTFKYRANSTLGTLEIGKKNTYTAKAYDEGDGLIGSASITIDVESGSSASPVITMPTSLSVYTTTLDEVVIGGSVGKWVKKVYINDQFISEYIPGSTEWRKTIKLSSGENVFSVYGENDGGKTASVSIKINYQP